MMTKNEPELDRLFYEVGTYRTSKEYLELLNFVKRFRNIAPYNAMLLHVQNPNCSYVATSYEWKNNFGRTLKKGARPLVMLRPFGPVSFVFDIDDTEGEPCPLLLTDPFFAVGEVSRDDIDYFASKMLRCGIAYFEEKMDKNSAGYITHFDKETIISIRKKEVHIKLPVEISVNSNLNNAAKLATIYHELGHLYCGHIFHEDIKYIQIRYPLPKEVKEFEAESVCWLLCERQGIKNPSAAYLNGYLNNNEEIPDISVETVLTAVAQIEAIYKGTAKTPKELIISK